MKPRVVFGSVEIGGHRQVEVDVLGPVGTRLHDALAACVAGEGGQLAEDLVAEQNRVALDSAAVHGNDDRLSGVGERIDEGGDDGPRQTRLVAQDDQRRTRPRLQDRKSTRLNSSHRTTSYAVFCLKK